MFVLTSPTKREINALSFSPDGRRLAVGGSQTGVEIWDVVDQRLVLTAWKEAFYIHHLLFSSGGEHLFVSAARGGARVVDLKDGRDRCLTPSPEGFAKSLALTPGGLLLVGVGRYGHHDAFLGAWDVRTPDDPKMVWRTPPSTEFCEYELMCLAPDNRSFAVKESGPGLPLGGHIVIHNIETWEPVRAFARPNTTQFLRRMLFSADGRHLLIVSESHLYCLNAVTGKVVCMVGKPGRGSFADLALHPAGGVLVSAHRGDRNVNLWNAQNLTVRTTYTWPIGRFCSVALSPDGLLAAAGNERGKIIVWDMDSGETPGRRT